MQKEQQLRRQTTQQTLKQALKVDLCKGSNTSTRVGGQNPSKLACIQSSCSITGNTNNSPDDKTQ